MHSARHIFSWIVRSISEKLIFFRGVQPLWRFFVWRRLSHHNKDLLRFLKKKSLVGDLIGSVCLTHSKFERSFFLFFCFIRNPDTNLVPMLLIDKSFAWCRWNELHVNVRNSENSSIVRWRFSYTRTRIIYTFSSFIEIDECSEQKTYNRQTTVVIEAYKPFIFNIVSYKCKVC